MASMDEELRRLRAAVRKMEAGRAERDAIIRQLGDKLSLRKIATEAGMTHAGVKKVLDRSPHDRQGR